MRDFVVRPDNERFKCVPRIQSGNRRGRSWVHSRRGHHLVGCGYILRRLRASWRRAAELYLTRITKRSHDRILQCAHVITLDPELLNVVWNSRRDRFLLCLHYLDCSKPTLKTIRANLWLESSRQSLHQLRAFLVHTEVVKSVTETPHGPVHWELGRSSRTIIE